MHNQTLDPTLCLWANLVLSFRRAEDIWLGICADNKDASFWYNSPQASHVRELATAHVLDRYRRVPPRRTPYTLCPDRSQTATFPRGSVGW